MEDAWPEETQFNIENPKPDQDVLQEVNIHRFPSSVDISQLRELVSNSDNGSSQLAHLVKNWEHKQANAVRLLREQLDDLNKQQQESELKKLEILEKNRFDERLKDAKHDIVDDDDRPKTDAPNDGIIYWKEQALNAENLLEASFQREKVLMDKFHESIENLEKQSSPMEELSQMLTRADNFLHFVLQNAPVTIGHQDKKLRYRFIYNHFPSLLQEDIIGKTDVEIYTGSGVKECQEFKREVLERGRPAKREITFETELFGSKTFLMFVEPVFSKTGETIGVNHMGMEVTDQVRKREKMAEFRAQIAVQNVKETELNRTIHITEETMRAKEKLATIYHEIRSPLSEVLRMAENLSNTNLDKEQQQLVEVILSLGDSVLQLTNGSLDLSKVESG